MLLLDPPLSCLVLKLISNTSLQGAYIYRSCDYHIQKWSNLLFTNVGYDYVFEDHILRLYNYRGSFFIIRLWSSFSKVWPTQHFWRKVTPFYDEVPTPSYSRLTVSDLSGGAGKAGSAGRVWPERRGFRCEQNSKPYQTSPPLAKENALKYYESEARFLLCEV